MCLFVFRRDDEEKKWRTLKEKTSSIFEREFQGETRRLAAIFWTQSVFFSLLQNPDEASILTNIAIFVEYRDSFLNVWPAIMCKLVCSSICSLYTDVF